MHICDRKHLNPWVTWTANTTLTIILLSLIAIINGAESEGILELPAGSNGIIAAFADVNSDRLTDILMISKDQKSFDILLTSEENTDIIRPSILYNNLTCHLPSQVSEKESIVNLIPGDFDGDSRIDIAVITKESEEFHVRFVSGIKPNCDSLNKEATISSVIEPFMLDFNGDMICDLLTQDKDGKRSVHIAKLYSSNEDLSFSKTYPFGEGRVKILNPHSCTIVDINGDNLPDLIIPTEHHIEYWFGHVDGKYPGKSFGNADQMIPYPFDWREDNDLDNVKVGQSIFTDVDGNGKIEHLMPVVSHGVSGIWQLRNRDDHTFDWIPLVSNLSNANVSCNFEKRYFESLTLPITLRQGDIDNDGYPDLLATVHDDSGKRFLALLRNQADATDSSKRTFVAENLLPSVTNPIIGAFFDVTENGKMDVLVSTGDKGSTKLILMENKEALEANFLKMMVASRYCPREGCVVGGWFTARDAVNYGSNIPGAQINYEMPDLNGKLRLGTAGQLKQSSHLALETPYILFGLGKMANYIEKIKVTLPSEVNKSGKKRTLAMDQGYFPDAYIIVVPRHENPNKWLTKLFFTQNVRIMNTGYALLGTCALLIVIIVVLHRKELREDAPEAKEFRQNWLDRR